MCNILFNQKPAFACKGICPNCRRKSELTASQPELRAGALHASGTSYDNVKYAKMYEMPKAMISLLAVPNRRLPF